MFLKGFASIYLGHVARGGRSRTSDRINRWFLRLYEIVGFLKIGMFSRPILVVCW
jgi:hypothetical protein